MLTVTYDVCIPFLGNEEAEVCWLRLSPKHARWKARLQITVRVWPGAPASRRPASQITGFSFSKGVCCVCKHGAEDALS